MIVDQASFLSEALPSQGAASLDLAHFGKHPAWDDHMELLGTETVSINTVRQLLYIAGIGENLSSGHWETLRKKERLLPFDHEFLWAKGEQAVVGLLMASLDARGRDLYPLVSVCHTRGIELSAVLRSLLTTLPEAGSKLKAATERDLALKLTQGLQGRLHDLKASGTFLTEDERSEFLKSPAMGPDHSGFLRVLHLLLATWEFHPESRVHLRVPLCHLQPDRAFLLWKAFVETVHGQQPAVLLLRSRAHDYFDIIVGHPTPQNLYCLGAGPRDLAMTNEAPYTISDEVKDKAEKVFTAFRSAKLLETTKKRKGFWKRLRGES